MSSTYSPDLRIELIGTGDQSGVWGATTNNNLAYVLEQAVAGYVSVAVGSANQALTYINGATSVAADNQSIHASIALTTSTGANFAVYAPPASKQYTIYNASSYVATIYNSTVIGNTTAAGTGVAIPAGKTMTVWSDGTNFSQQNTHLNSPSFTTPALGTPASGTLTNATGLPIDGGTTGTLPVLRGGTGVTTSTGSGNNVLSNSPTLVTPALGTPSSATLTNATGLPIDGGTTGTLPVSRGGTGATSITSGALIKGAGTGAFAAASASDIVGQIGSTAVQNATTAANGGVTSVNSQTGSVVTTAYGGIGSYVIAGTTSQPGASGIINAGDTVAGSTLVRYNPNLATTQPIVSSYSGALGGLQAYDNAFYGRTFNEYTGASESLGLSGTWRLTTAIIMGTGAGWNTAVGQYVLALFVRIS